MSDWEAYLRDHFLAWMLPSSRHQAISTEEAERFLERFACRPIDLRLICATSLLADPKKAAQLEALILTHVPSLLRELPSRAEVVPREWVGGFRGRLDVRRTVALHVAGKRTHYATRDRIRRFDVLETVLLVATLRRLLALLSDLREEGILSGAAWGAGLLELEPKLRRIVTRSALRGVEPERPTPLHVAAARQARHRAYRVAAMWHGWLDEAMGSDETRARHLAAGALAPLGANQRFEVAVLVRLVERVATLADRRAPGRWRREQSAILAGSDHVAALVRDDDARLRFFYNRAVLPAGQRDRGVAHYLGGIGRMRPDITVLVERPGEKARAMVVEIKRSHELSYLAQGFGEALLYRHEYDGHLIDWPKAVLVTEAGVPGPLRANDEVVAAGWADWAPEVVCERLIGVLQ